MMSNVRVIKLMTGEELIANVEEMIDGINISDCIAVIPQSGPTDPKSGKAQIMFAFIPWGTLAKGKIYLDHSKIMYNAEPEDELVAHYNKLSGKAKIEVPPKNLVIAR